MGDDNPGLTEALAAADRALAAGNAREARAILESIVKNDDVPGDVWRRLATVRHLVGAPAQALAALDRALELEPLDFVNLLMRARILDQLGHAEAGEAYGRALAQSRPEPLPSALAGAIARAEAAWQQFQASSERQAIAAIEAAHLDLTPSEKWRAERLASNISRRTKIYHSEPTHFHYPNLREIEFHDRADFPWLQAFEHATDTIAAELAAVASANDAILVPYVQYSASEPLAQWRELNHNRDWTAIHLVDRGKRVEPNADLCPTTMALLDKAPQPWIENCGANAMFSLLAPKTSIPPHVGVSNFRLVCHVPLIIPEQCWFRVGETTRYWELGEAWVFDDSIEHEACNPTDHLRVIMIFDVWHPDLSPAEQQAISAIVGARALPVGSL